MLIIKSIHLIDPASSRDEVTDIVMEAGRIKNIGPVEDEGSSPAQVILPAEGNIYITSSAKAPLQGRSVEDYPLDGSILPDVTGGTIVIDGQGWTAAPGLVDVHVHFRDPGPTYKEDIHTGAQAAAAGGYTSVIMMANTKPVTDSPELLSDLLSRGKKVEAITGVHIYSSGAITKGLSGRDLTDMEAMLEAGARGFTDDGIPLLDRGLARRAMEEARRLHTVLAFHEEDPAYILTNGINRGRASEHFGIGGSDRQAEITMVERDISLARETGASIHIQHISCAETVDLIREAKKAGVCVTGEATPHHFTLTEEAAIKYGTLAKMNPPLRTEADRRAIIEGLRDGTLDIIATDHAPHSEEEKQRPITEAPSGIIGLQTALPLALAVLVKQEGFSLKRVIELMSYAPARLYGLEAGFIREGGPADMIFFRPDMRFELRAEDIRSKSQNTPFMGIEYFF